LSSNLLIDSKASRNGVLIGSTDWRELCLYGVEEIIGGRSAALNYWRYASLVTEVT